MHNETRQREAAVIHGTPGRPGTGVLLRRAGEGGGLPLRPLRRPWILTSICLFAGHAAMADETKVYEWREADGVMSCSNMAPPVDAKGVTHREIDTASLTPARQVAIQSQRAGIDAGELAAAKRSRERVDAADLAIDAALGRLRRDEAALRRGRTPRAGERVGNDGRFPRLRIDHFARQDQLAATAQAAREQVAQAYRQREGIAP